jgi:hypothetical protein
LNPVTGVLSAIVVLLQSPQCMSLIFLLTIVFLSCDVKFSLFRTDETVFSSVGNVNQVTSISFFIQRSTTLNWISCYVGCRKRLMNWQWWCWWYVARLSGDWNQSGVFVLLWVLDWSGWCLFYWQIWDIAWSKCCLCATLLNVCIFYYINYCLFTLMEEHKWQVSENIWM